MAEMDRALTGLLCPPCAVPLLLYVAGERGRSWCRRAISGKAVCSRGGRIVALRGQGAGVGFGGLVVGDRYQPQLGAVRLRGRDLCPPSVRYPHSMALPAHSQAFSSTVTVQ